MNISSRILSVTAAVLALGIGGFVYAQASQGVHDHRGGGMGMQQGMGKHGGESAGMRRGMGGGMRNAGQPADAANRLAAVRAELQITADQESAWQAYETSVRQQADVRQAMSTGMRDPSAAASVDRAAVRETMQKYRESEQVARNQARQALYAVLSPAQKVLAGQRLLDGRAQRMGGHRHSS